MTQTRTRPAAVILTPAAEARIAALVTPGPEYTVAQWAIWRAGGIMLPLSASAAEREWEHALTDAQVSVVIADAAHAARNEEIGEKRDFLQRQNLVFRQELHSFCHAVAAAQVASIRNGNPQIIDPAAKAVGHGSCGRIDHGHAPS